MKTNTVRNMVLGAMFLALGLLLPFLTGQLQEFGSRLLPMHIPVLICGFACSWKTATVVGIATPILRSFIFTMPKLFPMAVTMMLELGAYAFLAAILYTVFKSARFGTYIALIGAMLGGRIVWGIAAAIFYPMAGMDFSLSIFAAGAFANAVPGIILQIAIVPPIVYALKKADLLAND